MNKGIDLLQQGDMKNASVHFKKATGLDPGNYNGWLYLGITFNELQEYKDALAAFKKCTEIDETQPYAWSNMGIVYQRTNDVFEAARHFVKASKLDPSDLGTRLNLGLAYLKMRNKEYEALQEFKFVLEQDSNIDEAWHQLGLLYMDMLKKDLALFCLQKARMLGLDSPRVARFIRDLKFESVSPKNPFDDDVKESAFNPLVKS